MNWNEILTDPATYVVLYVLSLIVGIPTVRHMLKDVMVYLDFDIQMFCFIAAVLVIASPVTVVAYWVAYKLVIRVVIYHGFYRMCLMNIAELVLPERVKKEIHK